MNWATGFTLDKVDDVGGGAGNLTDFGTDSRSLLAIEDITVNLVAYTGCLKVLSNRSAMNFGGVYQAISWVCPNDGMVKRIVTKSAESWLMEFDPISSTQNP